jgi:hypothetical protein
MQRLVFLVVGLVTVETFGLVLLQVTSSAALAPAPFIFAGFALGAILGVLIDAIVGSAMAWRVAVLAALIVVIGLLFGGAQSNLYLWAALLPSTGLLAASLPPSWLSFNSHAHRTDTQFAFDRDAGRRHRSR